MEAYKWKLRNIFIIHHHQKKYVIREHFLFSAIVLAAQMPGLCPWRYLFIFLSRVFTYVRSLSYCGECGLSVLFVSYICRLFYLFSLFLVFWFWWWGQWDIRRPAKEAFFINLIIHAHYTRNKIKWHRVTFQQNDALLFQIMSLIHTWYVFILFAVFGLF